MSHWANQPTPHSALEAESSEESEAEYADPVFAPLQPIPPPLKPLAGDDEIDGFQIESLDSMPDDVRVDNITSVPLTSLYHETSAPPKSTTPIVATPLAIASSDYLVDFLPAAIPMPVKDEPAGGMRGEPIPVSAADEQRAYSPPTRGAAQGVSRVVTTTMKRGRVSVDKRRNVVKRRGRPVGSKNKPKRALTPQEIEALTQQQSKNVTLMPNLARKRMLKTAREQAAFNARALKRRECERAEHKNLKVAFPEDPPVENVERMQREALAFYARILNDNARWPKKLPGHLPRAASHIAIAQFCFAAQRRAALENLKNNGAKPPTSSAATASTNSDASESSTLLRFANHSVDRPALRFAFASKFLDSIGADPTRPARLLRAQHASSQPPSKAVADFTHARVLATLKPTAGAEKNESAKRRAEQQRLLQLEEEAKQNALLKEQEEAEKSKQAAAEEDLDAAPEYVLAYQKEVVVPVDEEKTRKSTRKRTPPRTRKAPKAKAAKKQTKDANDEQNFTSGRRPRRARTASSVSKRSRNTEKLDEFLEVFGESRDNGDDDNDDADESQSFSM